MPPGAGRTIVLAALSGLLAGLLGGGAAVRWLVPPPATKASPDSPPAASPVATGTADGDTQQQIVAAVKRAAPAVVNIDVVGPTGAAPDPWADTPGVPAPEADEALRGSGSGFVFDAKAGLVMTNQHVVEKARRIDVTLSDGRAVPATVVGADKLSDIALLKLQAAGLPEAALGLKAKLEQGQWAIAIGNPFRDFPHTVTVGVISALDRTMTTDERDYRHLIQTDTAINMGNSGGPLVNLQGEVIGVNAAIFSPTRVYAGLGFAISINDASRIASHLRDGRGVPWLGLRTTTLNAKVAAELKVDVQRGVYLVGVSPGGPAEQSGLREHDVIVAVEGKPCDDGDALQDRVLDGQVGEALRLTIRRAGKERQMTVKLGARPQ